MKNANQTDNGDSVETVCEMIAIKDDKEKL